MKPFTTAALVIFALVAVLHAFRLLFGWSVTVDGVAIPMCVSSLGLVVAAGLAIGLGQGDSLSRVWGPARLGCGSRAHRGAHYRIHPAAIRRHQAEFKRLQDRINAM